MAKDQASTTKATPTIPRLPSHGVGTNSTRRSGAGVSWKRDIAMQPPGYVPFQSMMHQGMGYNPGLRPEERYPMVGIPGARDARRDYQLNGNSFTGVPRNTTFPLWVAGCQNEVWW